MLILHKIEMGAIFNFKLAELTNFPIRNQGWVHLITIVENSYSLFCQSAKFYEINVLFATYHESLPEGASRVKERFLLEGCPFSSMTTFFLRDRYSCLAIRNTWSYLSSWSASLSADTRYRSRRQSRNASGSSLLFDFKPNIDDALHAHLWSLFSSVLITTLALNTGFLSLSRCK